MSESLQATLCEHYAGGLNFTIPMESLMQASCKEYAVIDHPCIILIYWFYAVSAIFRPIYSTNPWTIPLSWVGLGGIYGDGSYKHLIPIVTMALLAFVSIFWHFYSEKQLNIPLYWGDPYCGTKASWEGNAAEDLINSWSPVTIALHLFVSSFISSTVLLLSSHTLTNPHTIPTPVLLTEPADILINGPPAGSNYARRPYTTSQSWLLAVPSSSDACLNERKGTERWSIPQASLLVILLII